MNRPLQQYDPYNPSNPPLRVNASRAAAGPTITLSSDSWAVLDWLGLGTTLTIRCSAGDVVQVILSGQWAAEADTTALDPVSIVGGTPLMSWAEDGPAPAAMVGGGVLAWQALANDPLPLGGSISRVVTAAEIVNGILTVSIRGRITSAVTAGRDVVGQEFTLINLGQPS